ncbi:hypothetical protein KIPB_015117, partial [Kipferlia bialata]
PPQIPTISVHGSTLRHLPHDPHVHHTMPGIGSVTRTAQQYPYHSPSMCRALGPPLGPASCDIDDTRPYSPSSRSVSPVLSYGSNRDGGGIQFDTASCDPPWDAGIPPMLPSQFSEATGKSDVGEEGVGVTGPQPLTVVEGSLETLPSHVRLRGTGSTTRTEGGPMDVAEEGSEIVHNTVALRAANTPRLLPPTPLERVHSYMGNEVGVPPAAPDPCQTDIEDEIEWIETPGADVESLSAMVTPLERVHANLTELHPSVSYKHQTPLTPDHPTTGNTRCSPCAPAPPTPRGAGLDWWIS